jgi:hypothetical protein
MQEPRLGWWVVTLLLCGGCDGPSVAVQDAAPPSIDAADDTTSPAPDLPPAPDASPGACGASDLEFSVPAADVLASVVQLVAEMKNAGATQAYFSYTPTSAASEVLIHAQVDLPSTATADPPAAALAWLAALKGSPIRVDEYALDPEYPPYDASNQSAAFVRKKIEDEAFPAWPRWGVAVVVDSWATGAKIQLVRLFLPVVYATAADAKMQNLCSPAAPPAEDSIRAQVFTGLEMVQCATVGAYQYTSNSQDAIAWAGDVRWTIGEDAVMSWVPVRKATLQIHPSNYWEGIQKADCYCHDEEHTGFTLEVHAITGEVLQVTPGINCVVC